MKPTTQQQRQSKQNEGVSKNLISTCLKDQKEKKQKIELPTIDDDWENMDCNQQDKLYEHCKLTQENLKSLIENQNEDIDDKIKETKEFKSRNNNNVADEEADESIGVIDETSINTRMTMERENKNKEGKTNTQFNCQ